MIKIISTYERQGRAKAQIVVKGKTLHVTEQVKGSGVFYATNGLPYFLTAKNVQK